MHEKYYIFIIIVFCFLLTNCAKVSIEGRPVIREEKKETIDAWHSDKAIYELYKKRHTIEGYKEFIAQNPENHFVAEARMQIHNIRFVPYQKMNTISGYNEFMAKYPRNPNVYNAFKNIEKLELNNCSKTSSADCYIDFLEKYPYSEFRKEALFDLKEVEFRQFDKELRNDYGFDLLLYRLNLRRLKTKMYVERKDRLRNFTCHAIFKTVDGKKYFHTQLTYSDKFISKKDLLGKIHEELIDEILSEQLVYLNKNFGRPEKIRGFSFEFGFLPDYSHKEEGDVFFEYYFPKEAVNPFAMGTMDKKKLLEGTIVVSYYKPPPTALDDEKTLSHQVKTAPFPIKKTAEEDADDLIVKWTSEEDGIAEAGIFERMTAPSFTFQYPKNFEMEDLEDEYIFNGKGKSFAVGVTLFMIEGDENEFLRSRAKDYAKELANNEGSGSSIRIVYNRPLSAYKDVDGFLPAYEFEILWVHKDVHIGKSSPGLRNTYANVISKDGYAIMLHGVIVRDVAVIKEVYKTLEFTDVNLR